MFICYMYQFGCWRNSSTIGYYCVITIPVFVNEASRHDDMALSPQLLHIWRVEVCDCLHLVFFYLSVLLSQGNSLNGVNIFHLTFNGMKKCLFFVNYIFKYYLVQEYFHFFLYSKRLFRRIQLGIAFKPGRHKTNVDLSSIVSWNKFQLSS